MLMTSPWRRNPELDVLAVDFRPVGALQIGEHELALVFLDLDVKAADAVVVELDGVAFFAADGDRRGQVVVTSPDRPHPMPATSPVPSGTALSHKVAGLPTARNRSKSTGSTGRSAATLAPDVLAHSIYRPDGILKRGETAPRFRRFPPAATPWLITCRRNGSQAASGPRGRLLDSAMRRASPQSTIPYEGCDIFSDSGWSRKPGRLYSPSINALVGRIPGR